MVRGASLSSSAKPRYKLPFTLSTSRPYTPKTFLLATPTPLPLLPVLVFASVETKTYSRASIDATVLLRAAVYAGYHERDNIWFILKFESSGDVR